MKQQYNIQQPAKKKSFLKMKCFIMALMEVVGVVFPYNQSDSIATLLSDVLLVCRNFSIADLWGYFR